ncbi:tetratricopeptide repeat protein 24 isoform X2 [Alosa alosa]|uniref:tetratricopeptide repeat protein 24 isoform X2 n=1 Tax=Alosa alosa TaxID=278164 RepID=UPI0020154331|nr:tetratricopeptide repeat protein 24 isoform X2 [Alosa alosa]
MASGGSSPHEGRKRKKKSDGSLRGKSGTTDESQAQADIDKLTSAGHSALKQGDCLEALNCFKKAYKAAVEIKETKVHRACAFNLGAAYVEAGKPQKGIDFLRKAQPGEKRERVADLQYNLGVAHEVLEDQAQAAGHYLQAAQLYRSQGDGSSEGDTCMKLARCHIRMKDWSQAAEVFRRAAESYRVAGRLDSAAVALKQTSTHMLQSESFSSEDVIGALSQCLELSVSLTDQHSLVLSVLCMVMSGLVSAFWTTGKLYNELGLSFSQLKLFGEAAECYEQALPLVRSKPRRLAVVLQNLGAVHNTLGQYQQALDFHREAAALHGSQGSRRAQGRCFSNLAFALTQLGELEEAGESYLHALQAFKDTEDYMGQWQACEGLGEIRLQLRDPDKATLYYKQALGMLSKCKDSDGSVQERLVNKLSQALQLRLALQQRGPFPRRANQNRSFHSQPRRLTDMNGGEPFQSHPLRKNQLNDHKVENGFLVGAAASSLGSGGEQRPHGETVMLHTQSNSRPEPPHTQPPDHLSVLPETNRNLNNTYEQPDGQNLDPPQSDPPTDIEHSDHLHETIQQTTTDQSKELPVSQGADVTGLQETDSGNNGSAAPPLVRWKSRFCTIMHAKSW